MLDRLADVTKVPNVPDTSTVDVDQPGGIADGVSLAALYEVPESESRPVMTVQQVARRLGISQADAMDGLDALADVGQIQQMNIETDPVVWYLTKQSDLTSHGRVVPSLRRCKIVVDSPTQYARARLSQFAHLADTTGNREDHGRGYLCRAWQGDVQQTSFNDVDSFLSMFRSVLSGRSPHLETWVEDQWKRAHQFHLCSHEEGYAVLKTTTEGLMGNVAPQELGDSHIHAPISNIEAWVRDEEIAAIGRVLYGTGYPVEGDHDLEESEELDVTLGVNLYSYQQDWVD